MGLTACTEAGPLDSQETKDTGVSSLPTVIVTGDMRGDVWPSGRRDRLEGGLARMTHWISAARRKGSVIVLDAGGRLARSAVIPVMYRRQAEAELEVQGRAARKMGLDAMAVGEADLAFGLASLRRFAAQSGAVLLSSNLVHTQSGTTAFDAWTLIERGDLRIGVVGASAYTSTVSASHLRRVGLRATPAGPAVEAAARAARAAGAESVIGLFHMSEAAARPLVAALAGTVNAVFVAHDQKEPGVMSDRWYRVGRRARHLVWLSLQGHFGRRNWVPTVVALRSDMPKDPTVEAWLDAVRARSHSEPITYAGSERCRACHAAAFRHWKSTAHARAWRTLYEVRQANNWDCIVCHATGAGRPGGPHPGTPMGPFVKVGCEACHGPGLAHTEEPSVPYPPEVSATICEQCHRAQANQRPFDFTERLPLVLGRGHGR